MGNPICGSFRKGDTKMVKRPYNILNIKICRKLPTFNNFFKNFVELFEIPQKVSINMSVKYKVKYKYKMYWDFLTNI